MAGTSVVTLNSPQIRMSAQKGSALRLAMLGKLSIAKLTGSTTTGIITTPQEGSLRIFPNSVNLGRRPSNLQTSVARFARSAGIFAHMVALSPLTLMMAVPSGASSGGVRSKPTPKSISNVPTPELIVMVKDGVKGADAELLSRVKDCSDDFTSSDLENILNQTQGSGWDAHKALVAAAGVLVAKKPGLLTTNSVPILVHLGKIQSSRFYRGGYGLLCEAIQKRPDIFDSAVLTDILSGSQMHEAVLELVKRRPELFTRGHFEDILAHTPNPWSDKVFFKLLAERPDFYADPFIADLIRVAMTILAEDGSAADALKIVTAISKSHPLRFNRDQVEILKEWEYEAIVRRLKAAREAALTATPK